MSRGFNFSSMYLLLLYVIFSRAHVSSAYIFNSQDRFVRSVIQDCRSGLPDEKTQCYDVLHCILNNVPSEYNARWSAGASILAFIPTIVGVMSNSIDELVSVADESTLLAAALSISNVTPFISRFGGTRSKWTLERVFSQPHWDSANFARAWNNLRELIKSEGEQPMRWFNYSRTQVHVFMSVAICLAALVWYEVYNVSKNGIVTFACPIKIEVGIWTGFNQLLALLNIVFGKVMFETRTLRVRIAPKDPEKLEIAPDTCHDSFKIVLKSSRDSILGSVLQASTAITSFGLYAYGTVILASILLVPASDAIRAMTIFVSSAGFGRLVGYWMVVSGRKGRRTFVIDVPAAFMQEFESFVKEEL